MTSFMDFMTSDVAASASLVFSSSSKLINHSLGLSLCSDHNMGLRRAEQEASECANKISRSIWSAQGWTNTTWPASECLSLLILADLDLVDHGEILSSSLKRDECL